MSLVSKELDSLPSETVRSGPLLDARSTCTWALGSGACRIELSDVIGRGCEGTVYRAKLVSPSGLARAVAVKMFAPPLMEEAQRAEARLHVVAERLVSLSHPNVVQTIDAGMADGTPFVVTELVAGPTLDECERVLSAQGRRLPLDIALFVAGEVAEAMCGALEARDWQGSALRVLHGGLSRRNVLLSWRGEVKVSDFEVSQLSFSGSSIRSMSSLAARAACLAPEVAQGQEADARSDVFAFGVLLRELFVGPRFPSTASDSESIELARQGYLHPIAFRPRLPDGLEALLTRALEVEPSARYPSVQVLAADLRRILLSMGIGDGRYFLRRLLEREVLAAQTP